MTNEQIALLTKLLTSLTQKAAKPASKASSYKAKRTEYNKPKVEKKRANDRSVKNEVAVVKTFERAGFVDVTPRVDVLSFGRWDALGYKPQAKTGVYVKGVGVLFHKSCVLPKVGAENTAAQV